MSVKAGAQALRRPFAAVLAIAAVAVGVQQITTMGGSTSPRLADAIGGAANLDPGTGRVWLRTPDPTRSISDPRTIRSLLDIRKPMAFGEFIWNDSGVSAGPSWVRVDLQRQVISLFRGGNEIATAVIIYGAQNKPTPLGRFIVLGKNRDYRSAAYDAAMPFAMFLTRDGVAIHASDVRHRNATHGCIGVPIEFAERLYRALKVGDPVDIVGSAD